MGCCSSSSQKNATKDVIYKQPSEVGKQCTNNIENTQNDKPSPNRSSFNKLDLSNLDTKAEAVNVGASRKFHHQELIPKSVSPTSSTIISNSCCYFFGIDNENISRIYRFDAITESFSIMDIAAGFVVYNMSACVMVSNTCIYVTGGTNAQASEISNRVFQYNPLANNIEELTPFKIERYTHVAAFFDNKLYVVGGLGYDQVSEEGGEEQENLLNSVEVYDLVTKQWTETGNLQHARSLANTIIYKDRLYVLGGYVGEIKRTRTVERLNQKVNAWELITFKLPTGLESPFIFSPGPDQIQIIGGQDHLGSVSKNYIYNIKDKTYMTKKPMNHERVLHKGFVLKNKVLIFGGDKDDTIEEYHLQQDYWRKQPSSYRGLLNELKLFSYSQPILCVKSQTEIQEEDLPSPEFGKENRSKKCFIFGDEDTSFILEINFSKNIVREHPIPENMKLYAYQGATSMKNGTYLICGGINKGIGKISQKAYIYNPRNNTVIKIDNCIDARYTFNLIEMDRYAYAIGGRTWGEDDQAILNTCERYNPATEKWEQMAQLNHPRCSAMAFQLSNRIFILGGYSGQSQRWTDVEVFHSERNRWSMLKVKLDFPLEGSGLALADQKGGVFLIGGRTDDGDTDKIWKFDIDRGSMLEIGNLKEVKSLTKSYEFEEDKLFILGGENYTTEFFCLKKGEQLKEYDFSIQINQSLKAMMSKGKFLESRSVRFSLA